MLVDKAAIKRAVGSDRYEEGRRLARMPRLDSQARAEGDDELSQIRYDIVTEVVQVALLPDDSPEVSMLRVCELYDDFPTYTILHRLMLEVGIYEMLRSDMRPYYTFLGKMLDAESDMLADPASYHLWVDFFEMPDAVTEAWTSVCATVATQRGWQRLLEASGPVPDSLKIATFESAVRDPELHRAILMALYYGMVDVYGQMTRETLEAWLPRLDVREPDAAGVYQDLARRLADPRPIRSGGEERRILSKWQAERTSSASDYPLATVNETSFVANTNSDIPVYYVQCSINELERNVAQVPDGPRCFVCSVVVREQLDDVGPFRAFLRTLLERGAKYMHFAGPSSEDLHDLADELRDEIFPSEEDTIILTSWDVVAEQADVIFNLLFAHPAGEYDEDARIMFSTDAALLSALRAGLADSSTLY